MSAIRGPRYVHWNTSPACARILERLECQGEASPDYLSAACHVAMYYAQSMLLKLKGAGVIHVCAWSHNSGGSATPIYVLGPGVNLPRPKPATGSQRSKRRLDSMRKLWGARVASIALKKSATGGRVMVDGHAVRPRDHDAHIAGKVTR